MQVPVKNQEGQVVGEIELRDEVFAVPLHQAVIHQALVRQQANARRGTADTKTRAEVAGGGAKPWRQKGTGRARAGTIRAPHWRGGGTVFGPHPRDYSQAIPKKMRRLALRSVLSSKVAQDRLVILDQLKLAAPKTREMAGLLKRLDIQASALLVLAEPEAALVRSARNLPKVSTQQAHCLNVGELLSHEYLIMSVEAARRVEETFAPNKGQ
jgi:large subunit ribosomal protein L4